MKIQRKTRVFAVALVLMLAISMLAGCSMNDLGFMKLYTELAQLKSYTQSGEYSMEINTGALYSYAYEEEESEPIRINLDYTANVKQSEEDFYLDMTLHFGLDGKKKPYELNVLFADDVLTIPVDDCITLIMLSHQFGGLSDGLCADIRAELEQELAPYDYVVLDLKETYGASGGLNSMLYGGTPMTMGAAASMGGEISALYLNGIAAMFQGLESGMTSSVSNGYALEITPDNGLALVSSVVDYAVTNKTQIFTELMKLIKGLKSYYPDEMKDSLDMMIEEMEADEQGFYDLIDDIAQGYGEMGTFEKEMMALAFKGSYAKETITKSGKTYTNVEDVNLTYQGNPVFLLKGSAKSTVSTSISTKSWNVKAPITVEELSALSDDVERRVNYLTGIEFSWWNGSDGSWVYSTGQLVEGTSWTHIDSQLKEKTLYIGARDFCEEFGEEIIWDNAAKKAYVIRGDEKIEIAGSLEYTTLYVPAREFEKLGYTVSYEYDKEWEEHRVIISTK